MTAAAQNCLTTLELRLGGVPGLEGRPAPCPRVSCHVHLTPPCQKVLVVAYELPPWTVVPLSEPRHTHFYAPEVERYLGAAGVSHPAIYPDIMPMCRPIRGLAALVAALPFFGSLVCVYYIHMLFAMLAQVVAVAFEGAGCHCSSCAMCCTIPRALSSQRQFWLR